MKIEFYHKVTGDIYDDPKKFIIDHEGNVYHEYGDCYAPHIAWRIIDQWQPIETAPKDGTDLLLSNGCALDYGFFCKDTNKFTTENPFFMPTHWMLQPPNPKNKE